VQRVLITGMSGTGKTALCRELAARGYSAVDTDDDWPQWVTLAEDSEPEEPPDWIWREDLMQQLLASDDTDLLFVSGCRTNQARFYPQFDHIVLLTAPARVIEERLLSRTNNHYGKHPEELAQVLRFLETVEPQLRRSASLIVSTDAPLQQVVETVLQRVLR
jgi:broad-specificity NMP kinase